MADPKIDKLKELVEAQGRLICQQTAQVEMLQQQLGDANNRIADLTKQKVELMKKYRREQQLRGRE